jgi:hypothetical protein
MSLFVHALPSLQLVPFTFGLQVVWPTAGAHSWHWFPAFVVPAATHAPPITQLLGFGVYVHVPSPLQVSLVHARPSLQVYAVPPQVPAVQLSLFVHALPSLQLVPFAFGLQAI